MTTTQSHQPTTAHAVPAASTARTTKWPAERVLFAMAGSMALISALLAAVVSPWFLLLTAFVGVNQWMYVTLGACPASVILRKFGVKAQCRWR